MRVVRDHIVLAKIDHGPSYRRYNALQRQGSLKIDFREIFGVIRFSTFATVSARKRHSEWVDLGYSITLSARASSIGGTIVSTADHEVQDPPSKEHQSTDEAHGYKHCDNLHPHFPNRRAVKRREYRSQTFGKAGSLLRYQHKCSRGRRLYYSRVGYCRFR
jgi:hypothetical protein